MTFLGPIDFNTSILYRTRSRELYRFWMERSSSNWFVLMDDSDTPVRRVRGPFVSERSARRARNQMRRHFQSRPAGVSFFVCRYCRSISRSMYELVDHTSYRCMLKNMYYLHHWL